MVFEITFFFFKQKTAYEIGVRLVGSEMCIRDRSAMEQRYNIAEKLVSKQSYTSIMGNIGASSAIISRVSRVISREDSVLRRLLEEKAEAPTEE